MNGDFETLVAKAFLEASKLTPEQVGMLRFWRVIMRMMDEQEEVRLSPQAREAVEELFADDFTDGFEGEKEETPEGEGDGENTGNDPEKRDAEISADPVAHFFEYIDAHGIPQYAAAKDIGISDATMWGMRNGKRKPREYTLTLLQRWLEKREVGAETPAPGNPIPPAARN